MIKSIVTVVLYAIEMRAWPMINARYEIGEPAFDEAHARTGRRRLWRCRNEGAAVRSLMDRSHEAKRVLANP